MNCDQHPQRDALALRDRAAAGCPSSSSTHTSSTRASPSPLADAASPIECCGSRPKLSSRYRSATSRGLAEVDQRAPLEQQRAVAEALQRAHVVGDEHDRLARVAHRVEDVEALLLERGVADREHLVDQQDVGIDLDRHREREPDMHPRGVVLQLEVLELLELGELDHAVVALARLARRQAHHDPVHDDVVAGRQIQVEADAELDERRQAPRAPDVTRRTGRSRRCTSAACSCRCRCARRSRRTRPAATANEMSFSARNVW